MENKNIRQPTQKRSIEKKERIVKAGLKLFGEKGYYNTNTAEIAKEAGVSTGIVYSYFADKKDIFMDAIVLYASNIYEPIKQMLISLKNLNDIELIIKGIIELTINSHNMEKLAHEEMLAMSHLDEQISGYFFSFKDRLVDELIKLMNNLGLNPPNAHEKMHIIINIIEEIAHDLTYHSHKELNRDLLIYEAVKIIKIMVLEGKN